MVSKYKEYDFQPYIRDYLDSQGQKGSFPDEFKLLATPQKWQGHFILEPNYEEYKKMVEAEMENLRDLFGPDNLCHYEHAGAFLLKTCQD